MTQSTSGAEPHRVLPSLSEADAAAPGAQAMPDPMLGEILRRNKGLSSENIARALEYQRQNNVRFGEAVVRLGLATADEVVWAISQQFHYPYAAGGGNSLDTELVVAHRPFDDLVEVFRDVRTQLMLNGFGSADNRSALAVTSPNRSDGRTFFAANLAVAFGQLPGRTVIVDADLRQPRLHEIFKAPGTTGLTTLLSGRTEASVIRAVDGLPNLFLLPAGPKPPNPSELFLKPAFTLLLTELTNKFDYVIVDTPAADHGSDARVIASRCGSALTVSRRNHTRLPELQKLVTQLGKSHVKMAGVVMNDF